MTDSISYSGIRDNHTRGSVARFLKDKIGPGSRLCIVSAYFTIHAYEALAAELNQIGRLRFLFGEPSFINALDPDKTDPKSFKIEDEGLSLAQRLPQKAVARHCADWLRAKAEIRSIRQANFLHGKLYHIDDGRRDHAILGSSNFTQRGLGLAATSNIELNLVVDSDRDRADLKAWFDEIWDDEKRVEDVKEQVLHYLAQLYVDPAPEFVYFKTLFHVFEQFLSGQAADSALFDQTAIVDTQVWRVLFDFQKDGVKGAIHKINAHNGCILADSVGLGKTYSALAIIKYFELRNHRVLVLCPKKLRDNWTVYLAQNNSELNPFLKDRFAYTVLSHTDLSRDSGRVDGLDLATIHWNNFDLVVIDESDNFRNNTKGQRDEEGNVIRKSRYERLMYEIQDNIAYWKEFKKLKIISTKVSIEPTFSLDKTGSFLSNTSYSFVVNSNPLYLLAFLNSNISAFYAKSIFVEKQNGWYEVQPDTLEKLPIPKADAQQIVLIDSASRAILAPTTLIPGPSPASGRGEWERLINGLVYEPFFPDDLHQINIRLFDAAAKAGLDRLATLDGSALADAARDIATVIFPPSHPIQGMLADLQKLEVLRVIEGRD